MEALQLWWNEKLLTGFHHADAALPFSSTRNSASETVNSAFPHFKQTNNSGDTQTMGLLRPFSPEKWMATSALNLLCLSDPHCLHVKSPSFVTRIDLDCVVTTAKFGAV